MDYNAVNEPQFQLTDSESVRPATQEEREETAYMAEHLNAMGIPVSTDWEEGQRVLAVNEAVGENDQVACLPGGKYAPAYGIGISVHDTAKNGEKHGQVKPLWCDFLWFHQISGLQFGK